MKKPTFCILFILSFITSCKQEQNKTLPTEAESRFSETLIVNFTEEKFLEEEENFTSNYNKESKRSLEAYEALVNSLFQQQKIDAAIIVLERSASIYTENEDILGSLATLYEMKNNKAAAIKNLDKALAIANKKNASGKETLYTSELKRLKRRVAKPGLDILFEEDIYKLAQEEKELITNAIVQSEKKLRTILPTLPKDIRLIINIIDREINSVGGVTGRTETHTPGEILIEISNVFPGGVSEAVKTALEATLFHEFHHIYRGWAMKGNKFGPGIPNAMVNEGLAVVFSEIYTGKKFEVNSFSKEADNWVREILALPLDASYSDWVMGEHPDGRTTIGYRSGNYLIRKTIANSEKNILELSELSSDEIFSIANYK